MVGVSCALALQARGFTVTLLDRRAPGEETSYGNAGVIARSSFVPFNQPALWRSLPRLLSNASPQFRFRSGYLFKELAWCLRFLAHATPSAFHRTCSALDALIRLSMTEHEALLSAANALEHRRTNGWMFLYRSENPNASAASRRLFKEFSVSCELLNRDALSSIEPALSSKIAQALWIQDSWSVDDPGLVVKAYAQLFITRGGKFLQQDIATLARSSAQAWTLTTHNGGTIEASQVIIALGPWSPTLLAPLGMHIPMAFERGYHMQYAPGAGPALHRPVYDSAGGYVLSPMRQGLRLTTGVELNDCDAPANPTQLSLAEQAARAVVAFGERLDAAPWLGRRPTLPDSRPMIGAAPGHPGLWLAFGHQHIGFSTGPGTAALLAAQMTGAQSPIDGTAFRPDRFI
jgi:D-amino-acid dehydrogenase